jgi:hypothetical protein
VLVPGKPFQPILIFVRKAGTYLAFQDLHPRVGSWRYPQTLDKARKAC